MTILPLFRVQQDHSGHTLPIGMFPFWRALIKKLSALLVVLVGTLSALGQFHATQWNADSGLPQNSVRGIVQTPDGYIWLATLNGVARFDGVRFTIFDKSNTPGMSSNRFIAMVQGQGGDFWLAAEDGNVVRYHDKRFRIMGLSDGIRPGSISGVTSDDEGSVWIVSDDTLYRWNALTNYFDQQQFAENKVRIHPFWWIGTGFWALQGNQFLYFLHGVLHRSMLPPWIVRDGIKTAAVEGDGTIWMAMKSGGFLRISNQRYERLYRPFEIPFQEGEKQGWTLHIEKNLDRYFSSPSLDHGNGIQLNIIMTDREGNTWIGSERSGLFCIQRQSIIVYSTAQGLAGENIYPVLSARNGDIWVGSWPEGLSRIRDGKVFTYTAQSGLPGHVISLAEDQLGNLWVGTHGGMRVLRQGRFIVPENIPNDTISLVQVIYPSMDGSMLLGTYRGVYVISGSHVNVLKSQDGLATDDARVIIKDHTGDIWIGGYGGITKLNRHLVPKERWTEQNGLPSNNVRSIYEDPEGNIWVGTYDGGLGLFRNGSWTSFNVTNGLYDNGAFQILEDNHQNLWMSSNHGIYRVSKADLYAFADGKKARIQSVGYGKADGMLSIECNGGGWPSGAIDKRGFLWFPTQDGVAVLNPDVVSASREAPRVIIESAAVDHTELGQASRVVLEPDQSNLEIRYTALNFSKPEQIEFRYKLDDLDPEWEYVGQRRTAYYKHLPPGNYIFHVNAVNSDGIWSKDDPYLTIEVVPHFFQRWWFVTSLGLTLLGTAWFLWTYRINQLQRAEAAQKVFSQQLIASQEAERHRIAAELHDGLGQRLIVIKNLALFLLRSKGKIASEEEKRSRIEEISSEASAAMEETRAISYDLRPFQLDRLGLSRAIRGLVDTASRASGIDFRLELENIDSVFPEELEINFFRIIQEAVNNVIKHSGATVAEITVRKEVSALFLSIRDNGKGLAAETPRRTPESGGFGLTGMRERAHLLNGSLRISSYAGNGTSLDIVFKIEWKANND